VVNAPGWMQSLVEENGAGLCARAGDPAHLAELLERLADRPDEAALMGRKGRELAERDFDRLELAARLEALLARVAARGHEVVN
jgi:glycosyltransferase involved in cell wall biosynthesis